MKCSYVVTLLTGSGSAARIACSGHSIVESWDVGRDNKKASSPASCPNHGQPLDHTRCLRALVGQVLRASKDGGGRASLDNLTQPFLWYLWDSRVLPHNDKSTAMTWPYPEILAYKQSLMGSWEVLMVFPLLVCCMLNTRPRASPAPAMTQVTSCIYAVPWDKLSAALKHSRMAAATLLNRRWSLPQGWPLPRLIIKAFPHA